MNRIFDTHAHYYDTKFDSVPGGADAILSSSEFAQNICAVINVATNPENSITVLNQVQKYDFMYAAIGIHPEDCQTLCVGSPQSNVQRIRDIVSDDRYKGKIVAIGEIGCDYYWQPIDKKLQLEYFDLQMKLAKELGLPVIIHNRESHKDVYDMIKAHPDVTGIIHSCSMSAEMALDVAGLGWYISFSGTLTFKNAEKVRRTAKSVPLDKILIETDAPYLSPHPMRGKINDSTLMKYTAQTLAQTVGIEVEEAIRLTRENACRVFGLQVE